MRWGRETWDCPTCTEVWRGVFEEGRSGQALSVVSSDRKKSNQHELKHSRFHLNIRKCILLGGWQSTGAGCLGMLWNLDLLHFQSFWGSKSKAVSYFKNSSWVHLLFVSYVLSALSSYSLLFLLWRTSIFHSLCPYTLCYALILVKIIFSLFQANPLDSFTVFAFSK